MRRTCLIVSLLTGMTSTAWADLEPISYQTMSDVTGQAFVSVDREYHPDQNNNTAYTRVNLGMDVDIQTNINELRLGNYEREGEKAGTADVSIDDFSLGYINNGQFFQDHPNIPEMRKEDGSDYAENEIVPFKINDPFLEFAFDEQTDEVIGVRLGFGKAMGVLSGKIAQLTGNVNVDIVSTGGDLEKADQVGDASFIDNILKFASQTLESDKVIQTKAKLVSGAPKSELGNGDLGSDDPNLGNPDPVRAEYIGVPDGEKFRLEGAPNAIRNIVALVDGGSTSNIELPGCGTFGCGLTGNGPIDIIAEDCVILGIVSCFPLSQYNSFPVGKLGGEGNNREIVAPADGAFMSFQTKKVEWLKNVRASADGSGKEFVDATAGAFLNIPNGATEVSLPEALQGLPRYRSEYIDRGQGLF